jgi:hypothetical protein
MDLILPIKKRYKEMGQEEFRFSIIQGEGVDLKRALQSYR